MPLITSTFSHLLDLRHAFISVVSIFLTIKMKFGVPDAFINLKAFFDVCFTCSTETVRYCDAVFHCLTSSLHLIINVFFGMERYAGRKERVCGVSKESNSTALRNPRGQRISVHEFEID